MSPTCRAAAAAVAAVLVREGIDYAQSKAVIKAARARAGLRAPPERRGAIDRLTVEEELRILDRAYARRPHGPDAADPARDRGARVRVHAAQGRGRQPRPRG